MNLRQLLGVAATTGWIGPGLVTAQKGSTRMRRVAVLIGLSNSDPEGQAGRCVSRS